MQRFLAWLKENGASFPDLTVETIGGIRGIKASRRFAAEEAVLRIPDSLWITKERALESETGKRLSRQEGRFPVAGVTYLAAFLLQVRKEGGFWQPYVDVLPASFEWHPLLLDDAALACLRGSHWLSEIQTIRYAIAAQYQQVINVCFPQEDGFAFDDFMWGMLAVMTRTFGMVAGNEIASTMVPLADMVNHAAAPSVRWTVSPDFSFVARDAIEAGSEVCGSYGTKSKGSFFAGYGFCVDRLADGNSNDSAKILLPSLPDGHPYAGLANHFGSEWDENIRAFEFRAVHGTPGVRSLFSYLRLLAHLEGAAGVPLPPAGDEDVADIPPLGRENEIQVLSRLEQICALRLRGFETSMEEDRILLERRSLSPHLHFAVMVRHGEKQVLQHFIDLAKVAIPRLKEGQGFDRMEAPEERFSGYFAELGQRLAEVA